MAEFKWDDHPVISASEPSFNWDNHPVISTPEPKEEPGIFQSMVQGAAPLYQHTSAAGKAGLDALTTTPNEGESMLDVAKKSYKDSLAQTQQLGQEAKKAHPVAATIGAGIGAAPLIAAAPQTLPAQMGAGGVVAGLSSSNPTDPMKLSGDVAGGVLGGGIGYGLGKVIAGSPQALKDEANQLAVKAAKGTAGQYAKLGPEGQQALGASMLKNKLVPFGGTSKDILARSQALKQSSGEALGNALDQEGTAFGGKELAEQARQQVIEPLSEGTTLSAPVKAAENIASNLENREVIPFSQLQQLKSNLGKEAYNPLGTVEKEGYAPMERFMNEHLENAVEQADLPALQQAKSQYTTAARAENLASKGASRGFANQGFGLGDKAAAGAGMMAAGPKGAVLGFVNKLVRERGQSAAAVGMDKLSSMLSSNPEAFGMYAPSLVQAAQRGPNALAAAHFVLSQKDSKYQQLMDNLQTTKK